LSVVDNTVDTQTGTIHLKATLDNADRLLWPGEFVDVVLTLDAGQNATVIPSEAVQAGQRGQLVYVVKPDKTVEPRMVSVGRTLQGKVIVEKGVSAGETVVTDGQMLLYPGAHIMVATAPKGDIGVQ
jgi:multidrug efflux system membrane fusion protein